MSNKANTHNDQQSRNGASGRPIATEIDEAQLDTISGGPHFRTWDGTYYDYYGGIEASEKSKNTFTAQSMGWDNVKNVK